MSHQEHDKLEHTQRQVDDVVGVMRDNVEMVLERDARLTDLEDRSNTLEDGAQRFQSVGRQVCMYVILLFISQTPLTLVVVNIAC